MAIYERMDQVESVAKQAIDQSDSDDSDKAESAKDEEEFKANQMNLSPENIQTAKEKSLEVEKPPMSTKPPTETVVTKKTQVNKQTENEAIKIIDFKDQASKTMNSLKLKQKVNVKIPKPNLEDDQVKFQES